MKFPVAIVLALCASTSAFVSKAPLPVAKRSGTCRSIGSKKIELGCTSGWCLSPGGSTKNDEPDEQGTTRCSGSKTKSHGPLTPSSPLCHINAPGVLQPIQP